MPKQPDQSRLPRLTFRNRLTRLELLARLSSWLVAALVLGGAVINLFRPVYFEAAIALASLLVFIWIQFFLERTTRIHNPPLMQLLIALLVFLSVFIGRFFSLYKHLPGFDKSQHFLYGMIFSICGFILFYLMNAGQRRQLSVSPATVAVFAAAFALACGFAWELFEFANDRLFNTNMQSWKQSLASGLIDTMADMVIDLAGSALVAVLGCRKLKKDPAAFYQKYIAGFIPGPARSAVAGGMAAAAPGSGDPEGRL